MNETLYDNYGQQFDAEEILFERRTDHQHLVIFSNQLFGHVMVLDGVVQTTTQDEFIYHEMIVHVPVMAHSSVKNVLVIGGGDGGALRELCKHKDIEKITLVEIDHEVISIARKYFPGHSDGAFEDPRVEIVIQDGLSFLSETDEKFDIIISDGTDKMGPGADLFTPVYYGQCKRRLASGGILVTQNGVPFMQPEEVIKTAADFNTLFNDWHFFTASVPTYVGGVMAFGWATDWGYRSRNFEHLSSKWAKAEIKTRYYTPAIHRASFVLPKYILDYIGKDVCQWTPRY